MAEEIVSHPDSVPSVPVPETPPPAPVAAEPIAIQSVTVVTVAPVAAAAPPRRRFRLLALAAVLVAAAAVAGLSLVPAKYRPWGPQAGAASGSPARGNGDSLAISVNTIHPRGQTLLRTLDQPGSLEADEEVELFAKVSGYVKDIARDWTTEVAGPVAAQSVAAAGAISRGGPLSAAAELAVAGETFRRQAPRKDLGSVVRAGEVLLEIDVPELQQDIAEKESLWRQAEAEAEAARATIGTFAAAVEVAQAQIKQAEADIRRFESECTYREQEYNRFLRLHRDNTLPRDVVDEKRHMLESARSACESSKAKVQTARHEVLVAAARLAGSRADLRVKEAKVQVARNQLDSARVMADFTRIVAPFDGVISEQKVESKGDFIASNQVLMTVTAIDRIQMTLRVPERDSEHLRIGTEAVIALDGLSGQTVKGRVARVSPLLDPQTRTLRVEIDLPNPDHKLKPGMYASQVTLVLQKIEHAYTIPATAVLSRKDGNYVLQVEDGAAHLQKIRIRYENGREIEAVKLLGTQEVPFDGSEEIIVSNKGEIAEGQKVRTTPANGH
jgi:HlyD family secretion protein